MKKKIAFLTPDCFLDVDIPIVTDLSKRYELLWVVLYGMDERSYKYTPEHITAIAQQNNFQIKIVKRKHRIRHPLNILLLSKMFGDIKRFNPDLNYFEAGDDIYFSLLAPLHYKVSNTVKGVHNVVFHEKYDTYLKRKSHNILRNHFKLFHFFSYFQADIFTKTFKHYKDYFVARLCQDQFSDIQNVKPKAPENVVNFLYFGNIAYYKGVDVLIQAANKLAEIHPNFKIYIAGRCGNWEEYEKQIEARNHLELNIKMINNEEIRHYLSIAHFAVLPYRSVTQSGVLSIFYNSGLPAIVSDIEGFSEFVTDGKTGFTFENENADSLCNVMAKAIQQDVQSYNLMRDNLKAFVNKELQREAITNKYADFFDKIIANR